MPYDDNWSLSNLPPIDSTAPVQRRSTPAVTRTQHPYDPRARRKSYIYQSYNPQSHLDYSRSLGGVRRETRGYQGNSPHSYVANPQGQEEFRRDIHNHQLNDLRNYSDNTRGRGEFQRETRSHQGNTPQRHQDVHNYHAWTHINRSHDELGHPNTSLDTLMIPRVPSITTPSLHSSYYGAPSRTPSITPSILGYRAPSVVTSLPSSARHLLEPGKEGLNPTRETFLADADDSTEAATEVGDETVYPSGPKFFIVVIALCFSVFLVDLDNIIITTAIPRITDQFHALDVIGWYGFAYFLTTCSFQLLFGKLYTFLSIKWVYLSAIIMFEAGSLLCGIAPNSIVLIVGRAVVGIGGAGISSGALIIIAYSVPLAKRPIFNAIFGAMYGLASVAGPLLGSTFTDRVTWRWCFYINLPIGAITFVLITIFFKSPKRETESTKLGLVAYFKKLDLLGTAVFIPAIVCILLALQWGGARYDWDSWQIVMLFCFFGWGLILWLAIQWWEKEDATVPLRILGQRSVAFSFIFSMSLGASVYIAIYYVPVYFQAIKNMSTMASGIHNLPMSLGVVVMAMASGILTTKFGYHTPFMIAAPILMAVGAGLLSTFRVNTGSAMWIGYQVIFGLGVGSGIQQAFIAVQTVLSIKDVAVGTSIIIFAHNLGGAVFVSVAQTIFTNRLLTGLAETVPNISPNIVLKTSATDLQNVVDAKFLGAVLVVYNEALDRTYLISAAVAAFSIVGASGVEWKSVEREEVDVVKRRCDD